MTRGIRSLYVLCLLIAAVSLAAFAMQGGFGGGHGDWDRVLWVLALPWALIPWPAVVLRHDLVWLTLLPFVLNVLVVTLLGFVKRA